MARGINTKHHSQINENVILPCNVIWQRDVITSVRIHIVCVPTRTFPLLVVAVTLAYKRWSKGTGALKGVAQKKENVGRVGGGAGGGHKDTAEIPSPLHPLEGNGDTWHSASLPLVLSSSKQPMQCSSSVASQIATQHTHAPPRVTFNTWNTRNAAFAAGKLCFYWLAIGKNVSTFLKINYFFNI